MKRIDCDYYYSANSGERLIPLRNVAEEFGVNYDILIERLDMGCPLIVALQTPNNWDIQSVSEDADGNVFLDVATEYLPIMATSVRYSCEDLLNFIFDVISY